MTYTFYKTSNIDEFDSFVIHSKQNTLFQCSSWADVKNNWDHLFTCVKENDEIVATALVLIRKLPLGKTLFYVPRGPVMDYNNHDLVSFMLSHLKEEAKKQHAIVLRFDPSILSRIYSYRDRNEEHDYENYDVIEYLKSLGAKHKGFTTYIEESTQPRFNAEMDVTSDYRERLEHKTAKCIRAAVHKGIQVYEGKEYIHDFSVAMHYTEVRKQIALRNEEYFENMMDVYGDKAICMVAKLNFPKQLKKLEDSIHENEDKLNSGSLKKKEKNLIRQQLTNDQNELKKLKADYEREGKDEVITCGILAVYNDNLMELFYMGNNPDYLRMYSSYLLYAKCLDRCVELGISHCSFGGIEGTLDDGLTLFKSNWLMNVEEYIGEFNIVLDPFMYKLFDEVYPWVRDTAAKFRGK
jgi:serine/alanine adding enzyme